MKLLEVIKELTEAPTKRFERKDRYKHWVIGTDVVGGVISGGTYYFMVDCYGGDSYGGAVRGETYCFSLECEGEDSYGDVGGGTYYFMVTCYGEDSYGDVGELIGNLANNDDDWQLVRQNAIKFTNDGFTIKLENGVELIHRENGIVIRASNLSDKDVLTRHKWPDEKPEDGKEYLVLVDYKGNRFYDTSKFSTGAGVWLRWNQEITHWWNLPEVKE